MSRMEDFQPEIDEIRRHDAVYSQALSSIDAEKTLLAARGHAMMAAILGYGEAANGTGAFGRVSHFAKLFCIGFALLAPSLLVWHVLL